MSSARNLTKFLVLCLVWGLTWIAVKVGVTTVPPMVLAATRFMAAGLILLGFAAAKGAIVVPQGRDMVRLLIASLLMITLCYGPLFWGMKFVASGTAAVLEMSLTPLALLAFGIAMGEERWSWTRLGALALGVIGLAVLFTPETTASNTSSPTMFGLAAVAWAAISSAWGSVLARTLVSNYGSKFLSGSTTLIGGSVLLAASLMVEPGAASALATTWNWQAIAGWLFLVIFGSLIGYSIYMQLLRDIGPARAGSFAFVSPAIAVAVGALLASEPITLQSVSGMVLMLVAAGGCLFTDQIINLLSPRKVKGQIAPR
ncbi:putative permease, DMT superfamily [Rhizobium leguminosarum bv. trifolii WSM2297]|uniref:Putative permease, DMT superfamily n=1 Tax=Rhizobium leguminosarum bv. trifolii WSM2297 TaxID=754762 RepID=J0CHB3_RHILT|nr:EamA family transporter [Rhizobium leguminosarum]EJC82967.1 putative permease, DMT superfamily [Rhizobium leguminosarum bv. trifolii WSM2297]